MRKIAITLAVALAAAAGSAKGAILINEINADSFNTPATDYLEFIELFSDTGAATDLSGLTLLLVNGNGEAVYGGLDLDGLSTNAGGYYLFGSNAVAGAQNTSLLGAGNILQNGQDAVVLVQGDLSSYPNGTVITSAIQPSIVDAIVYGTADPDDPELLMAIGDPVQYDEGPNPASDALDQSLARVPNGLNSSPFILSAHTPGGPNPIPEPGTTSLLALAAIGLLARRRRGA